MRIGVSPASCPVRVALTLMSASSIAISPMGTDMDSCTLTDTTLSRTIATVRRAAVKPTRKMTSAREPTGRPSPGASSVGKGAAP